MYRLAHFPRRRYTEGATALERLERLGDHLPGALDLWIKRDDQLGLAGGGNKTRKLEFLVADALAAGADTLVTTGAVQSNHCRLTLAAAVREGMKCRLVLEERVSGSYDPNAGGNNLLFRLMGTERIRVVPAGTDLGAAMDSVVSELEAEGRKGYVVPGGGSNPLGALGYVACGIELLQQAFDRGLRIDHIVCASGSGGTHAGIVAAVAATGSRIPVTGISVRAPAAAQEAKIRELARATLDLLGADVPLPAGAVTVHDDQVGPGYSLPTPAMVEAVHLLASREGILLDSVYTGKAMAGLLRLAREGRFARGETVVFLHTGGAPSLSAFTEVLLEGAPTP